MPGIPSMSNPAFYIGGGVLLNKDDQSIQLNINHTRKKSIYSIGLTSEGHVVVNYAYRFR